LTIDKHNEKDAAKQSQLRRYVETILAGAAEEGVRSIKFVPEDDDIVVYFSKADEIERRVLSIPIPSFAELWRLALAPGFQTGQHVMTVGSVSYLFRLKEGRMALGEEVTIEVRELKPHEVYPFDEEGRAEFEDEPWEKVRTTLDSIIILGLEKDSDRIEMHPGDPDVDIVYYIRRRGITRFPISKQTFRQIVHYMREYYFSFGFVIKRLGGNEYIIKPKLIGPGDDPMVFLEIEALEGEEPEDDLMPDDPL
jgi:hypothetical protein